MSLSISKISSGTFISPNEKSSGKNTPKMQPLTNSINDVNLNFDPKAVAFKGWFFSKKEPAANTPPKCEEPRIYGPYKLTKSELKENDTGVSDIVFAVSACMKKEAPPSKSSVEFYSSGRAEKSTIKNMSRVCLSGLCYYQTSQTSYPQFYDAITRAFPKACMNADKKYRNDNAARMYELTMKRIEKLGKETDSGSKDPIESGIKYLYFTNDLPTYKMMDDENSTEETIENMRNGRTPHLIPKRGVARCHMSRVSGELEAYGTPNLLKRFEQTDEITGEKTYENSCGSTKNNNFTVRPKPEPEKYYDPDEEPFDIWVWKQNP